MAAVVGCNWQGSINSRGWGCKPNREVDKGCEARKKDRWLCRNSDNIVVGSIFEGVAGNESRSSIGNGPGALVGVT